MTGRAGSATPASVAPEGVDDARVELVGDLLEGLVASPGITFAACVRDRLGGAWQKRGGKMVSSSPARSFAFTKPGISVAAALIKLIFDESGSELAIELWDRADLLISSQLVHPEARAALTAAARASRIDRSNARHRGRHARRALRPAAHHRRRRAARPPRRPPRMRPLQVQGDDILLAMWDNALNSAARATARLIANHTG